MGHFIFLLMHLAALIFAAALLWLTIPLHLIYGALSRRSDPAAIPQEPQPTAQTHVRCPDCHELVLKEARVCKHCRCRLVPTE